MVRQVGLLPAGSQPWNRDVCAASGDRFAYCATLAIYIYELDRHYNSFRLVSIMSEHKKTISAIAWNPCNPNQFASAGFDNKIIVWDVAKQQPVATFDKLRNTPVALGWCQLHGDSVTYISQKGPLFLWRYQGEMTMSSIKDTNFSSEVTCFRWHPKKSEKVAFGHQDGSVSFCSVGSKTQKQVLRPDVDSDDEDFQDDIVGLEWDPLSVDYILLSNAHSGVRLVDSVSLSVVMSFQLSSAATKLRTMSWIHSAPGMFLTGDAYSGILRVWIVSKSTPVEHIRVKNTGFHVLKVICDISRRNKKHSYGGTGSNSSQMSSTSMTREPTMVTSSHFALPPAQVVATFVDGGIGLYDLGKRKWEFLRDQGHIETIFDCKFSPSDSCILATGSFDGTLKLWDISSFKCTCTSPGNEGIIYSLSWAPSDLNCIVAGTSKSGIFIWDIGKGRIIKRFQEHGKNAVYTVAWNQRDSRRIMSSGGDGYCIIRQVNGEILQRYRHPASVYGCDWSPHNKDMLATGCEDKNVRVYYTATSADQPLKVFSGHSAKVFHVRWSPLKENLLCSGSDDKTVRVWDYSQEACISTLSGHSGPVRGLLWNTEVPYLIVSGSWDSTIRVWDARDGQCLDTIQDHGADVYGLTWHPTRPFILASSSRDSTVRLWSLTSLIQPVELNILAQRPWSQIISTPDAAIAVGAPPLLTGRMSKKLRQEGEECRGDVRQMMLKLFSMFFMVPAGTNNFWDLVSVVQGVDDTLLRPEYSQGMMHVKHLTKFYTSRAQELEMAKMTKFGGGIGGRSRDDRVKEAALLHAKTGNMQRYCELMVDQGEWERALAVAPAVSHSYWKDLATRYANYLIAEDKDHAIPFCTAISNTELLTDFYTSRGQMSDAVLAAQVACEGVLNSHTDDQLQTGQYNGCLDPSEKDVKLLHDTVDQLADWHLSNGSPVLSACCYLAVSNTQKALSRLIQGHELELAVAAGMVLKETQGLTYIALEMLSRRAERLGNWELAVDLLQLIPDKQLLLAKCCARWQANQEELDKLHSKARLPSLESCLQEAERLRRSDVFECVKYYLLSPSPELGLDIGLQFVTETMQSGNWTVDDVFDMIQLLGCIRIDVLQVHRKKTELLALCSYIGALVAVRRDYIPIVQALFQHARTLMQQGGYMDIGVTTATITAEFEAWTAAHKTQSRSVDLHDLPSEFQAAYQQLLTKAGRERQSVWMGPDCISSSHLPSHSDIRLSCLTGERIRGLAWFLEDGKSAVSPNEALMWAKVNPFSPLDTGTRINPF